MRSVNFRDNVLWAIAYKLGLDPNNNLLYDHADALASFINQWVRRTYDAADYTEWTDTRPFGPVNHVVPWDALPAGAVTGDAPLAIGRPLKVYLVDPATDWGAVDTAFRLGDEGIHVGFDHGSLVWIKFIPACPQFTAKVWDFNTTYSKGQVTYAPALGECYKSKLNANRGNEPKTPEAIPLTTEITQPWTAANTGVPATPGSFKITATLAGGGPTINDPPQAGAVFTINVYNAANAQIATATQTATGAQSIATILGLLRTTLVADPDLATFTITVDAPTKSITFSDASGFTVEGTYATGVNAKQLAKQQLSTYTPAIPATSGTPQITEVTITEDQVARSTQFNIAIIDAFGIPHVVSYTATVTDAVPQVLTGLAAALVAAGATDTVLTNISAILDIDGKTISFSSPKPIGLDATAVPAGNPYWDLVPFPQTLVEQVVRGAYADALKEQGQADKGGTEEQIVPTEATVRIKAQTNEQYDVLTDQQRQKTRYSAP